MSMIKNMDDLLSCKKKADGYARILSAGNFTDWQSLHEILYQFILCKYSLYGICHDIYSLDTLAQMSVAKTIQMTGKDAFKADSKASCEGTTSAMNKKILLLMAIQKLMGISFPREVTAKLTDTKLIARAVFELSAKTEKDGKIHEG
ncbi:Uncharacterised protein [uncultured Roseburia sp.]|uniref:Uncharacterized protein n=1 Tax=Brotonthovivens ammoniilytica TaxID=2981725 RepID=A0ABT2TG70_9FIRM|nr:hypothetical protein [Brotonthovivens ammoniilytica]MCU6761179.1 hypothetical protein [Brotonthovivens ammoniilytica]SCI21195.1 Uncharacterised protein [uncultured Roseburia sp.]